MTASIASAAPPTAEEKRVDEAIAAGLRFLAQEQQPSGGWRVDAFGESTAAASLSVMAFMAAGHVPGEGPYARVLERGIEYVIDHQAPNGMLIHRTSHGPFYSHGISTLMLAEAVGMVDERLAPRCRAALEKGIRLILDAQNIPKPDRHAGGWRYQPTSRDSDLSVTGWQLLALRAAKNVGCDVPAESIDRAVQFVKDCFNRESQGFSYQPGGSPTPTRTGTGILALEICGDHHSDEALQGADSLLRRPLRFGDDYFYYGAYYCSIGMFKMGGEYWEETKSHLTAILMANQAVDGSWSAGPGSERSVGKVYCTSMAILALAVEYQYLPIYQR
ncbi:MAG: prenyltransferase/squalene oxidase repeat-containing protein [Pirellulaceae bacterium]